MMIGKTMSGQHRIFGKSDQHKLRQSALKKKVDNNEKCFKKRKMAVLPRKKVIG